jgi:hypothetical protein
LLCDVEFKWNLAVAHLSDRFNKKHVAVFLMFFINVFRVTVDKVV